MIEAKFAAHQMLDMLKTAIAEDGRLLTTDKKTHTPHKQ